MFSQAAAFRPPTEQERATLLPKVSKGWANSQELPEGVWLDGASVEGRIPPEIHGTFFRNGPGLNVVYGTQLSHPIDGDGIVAALTFLNGRVHFRSRFVQTKHHQEEAKAKKMLYHGSMGSRAPKDTVRPGWRDPAHTNVFQWGDKLLACHEYALPHTLNPSTLETLGPDRLKNQLELGVLSAHYRYDADTDTLVTVAFKQASKPGMNKPKISFYEFDRNFDLRQPALRIELEHANYAHDFVLTPSWYIVHVSPFIDTRPETYEAIKRGEVFPGETMKYIPGAPSQMILISRRPVAGGPQVIRFDVDPFHVFHFCNGREDAETGSVTFDACCLPPGFTMEWVDRAFLSNMGDAPGIMHHFDINPNIGSFVRAPIKGLETTACEFPLANHFRHVPRSKAIKTDIFYMMASAPSVAQPFTDVVKYNASTGHVSRWHSEGVVGEPCFIPRLGRASAWHGDEDDGYVIVQMFRHNEGRVEFCILDAKKIHVGPVARIKLPVHLSIGFHGTWADEVFIERPAPSAKL